MINSVEDFRDVQKYSWYIKSPIHHIVNKMRKFYKCWLYLVEFVNLYCLDNHLRAENKCLTSPFWISSFISWFDFAYMWNVCKCVENCQFVEPKKVFCAPGKDTNSRHVTLTQWLYGIDSNKRLEFCKWALEILVNHIFLKNVLFSDEKD